MLLPVVIAALQMLLEVFLRVAQVALCLDPLLRKCRSRGWRVAMPAAARILIDQTGLPIIQACANELKLLVVSDTRGN